jgi:serine O-acetyltransferase
MIMSLNREELKTYLGAQLDTFFPDKYRFEGPDVDSAIDLGLERLERCFKEITFPAYSDDFGQTYFSHLHADQYAQFLYFFSNSLWKMSQNKPVCDKIMYLNRTLNNFFFSYKGGLPDIFFLGHPIGTVIGNAKYSDYLVILQNVTVNTDTDDDGNPAPALGKGLFLAAGAKIIGNKPIGDRVSISVDTVVYDQEIGDDKIVTTGSDGSIEIKDRIKKTCFAQNYFRSTI